VKPGADRPDSVEIAQALLDEPVIRREIVFDAGDTLDGLLARAGLGGEVRGKVVEAIAPVFDLRSFREGRRLDIVEDPAGRLLRLHYPVSFESDLCLWQSGDGFESEIFRMDLDWRPAAVEADLAPSFYEDLERQGHEGDLATRAAELFSGEIDFFFDLRAGDNMDILLERCRRPDRRETRSRILAARLTVDGRKHEAFLFPDRDGARRYFHADGSSLARQFLRAPLSYTRISSGFSRSRLHPILGIRRPHLGVDYAAPTGTPVKATADGVVLRRSRDREAGRFIKIRHAGGIETLYMHLSRFAPGTGRGSRVLQGQTIGYVGRSGLATGPHLDYRMKVEGKYIDPRRFRSAPAPPLPPERETEFARRVRTYRRLWGELRPPDFALSAIASHSAE